MYETISYVTENQKIGVTQQQNRLINYLTLKPYDSVTH